MAIVIVLGVGVVGYLLMQKEKTQVPQESNSTIATSNDKVAQNTEVSTTESAWDQLWAVYTSPQGISLKYPKQIGALDRCENKGHDPFVAMKILDDKTKGIIYAAPDYYYDYPATSDGSEDTTKPCQKIVNSLDQINGQGVAQTAYYSSGSILGGLNINVKDVKNQDELDKFIQDVFGSGCKIKDPGVYKDASGNVTSLDQMGGDYEIKLNAFEDANGNLTSLDETVCPVNYIYKIMYNKATNKAVAMNLGQDCTIDNGVDPLSANYECYTTEIADSIIFN